MLKKPYVSRVFGHLFDLVRTVMHYAYLRIRLATRKTFICITLHSTKQDLTAVKKKSITTAVADNKNGDFCKKVSFLNCLKNFSFKNVILC